MPVYRFRSVDEMGELAWLEPGSAEFARAIRRVWSLAASLAPWTAPPGVHRFRSTAEASAWREERDRECVVRQARRRQP